MVLVNIRLIPTSHSVINYLQYHMAESAPMHPILKTISYIAIYGRQLDGAGLTVNIVADCVFMDKALWHSGIRYWHHSLLIL